MFLVLNDRFHLAGEWVVGGFEAKGLAYFFVLMALGSLVQKQLKWVWPYLGFACAFHVLVGGWATIALLLALMGQAVFRSSDANEQREQVSLGTVLKQHAGFVLAGLLLAAVGALPPLLADIAANPATKLMASQIYVQARISHHLVFSAFSASRVAGFVVLLMIFGMVGSRLKRLDKSRQTDWRLLIAFAIGSLCISFCGLMLSGVSEQASVLADHSVGLLRFYWFRMADFAVPCAASLGLVAIMQLLWRRGMLGRAASTFSAVAIALAMAWIGIDRHSDPRPRADQAVLPSYEDNQERTAGTYRNWLRVCDWIKNNTPTDAKFITPDQQQTFKWYAHRSEVVNWKDVPQDAQAMVDWSQRVGWLIQPQRRAELGLMTYPDWRLRELAVTYGATHLLVPQRQVDLITDACDFKQVYPVDPATKATYVVFEFPVADVE